MTPLDILLVDDDALVTRALRRGLARVGHEVRVASGVDEARRMAGESRPDVVIADLHLGDGDGLSLLQELSERFREGPRVALLLATGDHPPPTDFPVLQKPFTASVLQSALEQHLG